LLLPRFAPIFSGQILQFVLVGAQKFFASGAGDLIMATPLTMAPQGNFKNTMLLTL